MNFFDFIIFVLSLVLFILWYLLDNGRKRTGKPTASGKNQEETKQDSASMLTEPEPEIKQADVMLLTEAKEPTPVGDPNTQTINVTMTEKDVQTEKTAMINTFTQTQGTDEETASATDGPPKTTKATEMKKIPIEKEDVNILILGETGVDKSTWINGIANYAKHDTLKDAIDDPEFTVLIPSRFTFTNDEGEKVEIAFASDSNEEPKDGESATQFPREYLIETETTRCHLIDTPGIGDSRSTEQDKKNFQNILTFLTSRDKINAVVVLLKSNSASLTDAFKLCVSELLTHVHIKSLVTNIIFAFTNSRGNFYRPGDTLPVLKQLLKDKNIDVILSPKTYFCFDNEAFRFLACQKKGVEFEEEEAELFSKSWEKSRDTTARLFDFVTSMPPLSLNKATNFIVAISKPMGEAVEVIEMNVKTVTLIIKLCKQDEDTIEKLQERLHFKGYERVITHLDHAMTVCAHEDCKEYQFVGMARERQTNYKTVCHDHCNVPGVPVETPNNEQLRGCLAMDPSGTCKNCQHNYKSHMHMTYTTTFKEKTFLSDEILAQINKVTDVKGKKEALIRELEKQIKENKEEQEIIYKCASHFGAFLKQNATIPYNDIFSDFLDTLIKDEEAKPKEIRDDKRIEQLKKDKVSYEEQKKAIIEQTSSPTESEGNVTQIKIVYEMKEQLWSLKHNGDTLRRA